MKPIGCPETSVLYYQHTPRNTTEERRSQLGVVLSRANGWLKRQRYEESNFVQAFGDVVCRLCSVSCLLILLLIS
jgi:hypothetical protein